MSQVVKSRWRIRVLFISVQFSSVAQLCPTLCDPMNHSMPSFPVHHQLLESTQTHVRRVNDAIQPSHPLSFPSPPSRNLSQHQGLFKQVSSSHQVAKVLEFQLHNQSFQWIFRADFLKDGLVWFPCSPRDSQGCDPWRGTSAMAIFKDVHFSFGAFATHFHDSGRGKSFFPPS